MLRGMAKYCAISDDSAHSRFSMYRCRNESSITSNSLNSTCDRRANLHPLESAFIIKPDRYRVSFEGNGILDDFPDVNRCVSSMFNRIRQEQFCGDYHGKENAKCSKSPEQLWLKMAHDAALVARLIKGLRNEPAAGGVMHTSHALISRYAQYSVFDCIHVWIRTTLSVATQTGS